MKAFVKTLASLGIVAAVALGCSRGDNATETTVQPPPEELKVQGRKPQFDDETVLIKCGDCEFTMGDAKRMAQLRARLMNFSAPPGRQVTPNAALVSRALAAAPSGFVRDCVIAELAKEKAFTANDEIVTEMRSRLKSSIKQDLLSWPTLMHKFSKEESDILDERIAAEALVEAARRWHAQNLPVAVSDEQIAAFRKQQVEYNREATLTNNLAYAQATNAWEAIKSGTAFEDVVKEYSTDEEESEDGEWGDFVLEFFDDTPELRDMIEKMGPGEFTPPMEGDNGLMIVRVNNVADQGDGKKLFTLSRVFFHLPEFYPELDDEEFAKEIRKARQDAEFEKFVTELMKKANVTYPNGETVFENARRIAAQPVMM